MSVPCYQCHSITRDLQLTGRLDDLLWESAPVVVLTHPITSEPYDQGVTVRLLYNSHALYVAFQCETDYVKATFTERDSPIWDEGCCEVFLCPSGKMRQYYELNVSPIGTVYDSFVLNGTVQSEQPQRRMISFPEFTCQGMIAKTHVEGQVNIVGGVRGWSAEYAIPFASVIGSDHLTPEPGDVWRMNLCAIASPKPGGDFTYYSWAKMGAIDFHLPWRFGELHFTS